MRRVSRPVPTVLVTGFEPFAGLASNPSAEAVAALDPSACGDAIVVTGVLPVSFADATSVLRRRMIDADPDIVICTGLASRRSAVCVEERAVNLMASQDPDNAGVAPAGHPVELGGPDVRPAALPTAAILEALAAAGIPARGSHDAGRFVCNQVLYDLLAYRATHGRPPVAGFVHLPPLPGQVPSVAGLDLATSTAALQTAVRASVRAMAAGDRLGTDWMRREGA